MAKDKPRVSPVGRAKYPRLNEPDTKFDDDGVYKLKLIPSDADAKKLMKFIDKLMAQSFKDAEANSTGKKKIKHADPPYITDEDDGSIEFSFKMRASGVSKKTGKAWTMRPKLFDAQGTPCPDAKVGGGSLVRVSFTTNTWHTAKLGAGVSLRLEAVQILELQEWGEKNADSFGFEEEEGFAIGDSPFEDTESEAEDTESDDEDEDDYDF